MDDFDLEGLSPQEAAAYVAQFIASLGMARSEREKAEKDLAEWKRRTALASDRGELDLAREALGRAEETHRRLLDLRREENELDFKVTELKRRLTNLRRRVETSVDAQALLEQLQAVAGPDREVDEAIARAEAETALEALRRKMEQDQ